VGGRQLPRRAGERKASTINGHIVPDLVNARQAGNFVLKHRDEVDT